MKDFTTPEYINPVLSYIDACYTPVTDKCVLDCLHADIVLQSNHSRNAYVIAVGEPLCMPLYHNDLFLDIDDYAKTAATYDGELDFWKQREYERAMNVIRDRIIEKYGKENAA